MDNEMDRLNELGQAVYQARQQVRLCSYTMKHIVEDIHPDREIGDLGYDLLWAMSGRLDAIARDLGEAFEKFA